MALYLVQHGQCLPKEQDPNKGLSEQGEKHVRRIARTAADYNVAVSTIAHSGKLRARQTAEIMAAALNPEQDLKTMDGMAPLDDVVEFAATLDLAANRMLVGHLPFLEKLIAYLIIGQPEPVIFQMQNGGIICLDLDGRTSRPIIKWTLMPKIG
jgi:phosphohistidine phosphatase